MRESVTEYHAALRKLATHCSFEDHLDQALRDRFVCGLRNQRMQRRLLIEADLDIKKALDLALTIELAERNVIDLQNPRSATVNTVSVQRRNFQQKSALQSWQRRSFHPSNNPNNAILSAKTTHQSTAPAQGAGSGPRLPCPGCGACHWASQCSHRRTSCYSCGKIDHISRVC